jgi:hypothetical protein
VRRSKIYAYLCFIMLRIVKHTIAIVLCLLITGGGVGVRVYVSACTHSGNVQLAMEASHPGCCSHDADTDTDTDADADADADRSYPAHPHAGGYIAAHEDACCTTSAVSISVCPFELSPSGKQLVDLPFATIPNLSHFACAAGNGGAPAIARAPRIADAASTPIIYLYGQLRL